jgi:hypothetical protein
VALAVVVALGSAAACTSSSRDKRPAPSTIPGVTATVSSPDDATALGAKFDWGRFSSFRDYVTGLSGSSTFYELVWCQVEPTQGERDWSTLDRIVERAASVKVQLMVKIRVGQCWATGGDASHVRGNKNKTESLMPQDLQQYADFVTAVVSRYAPAGVHEYAVENEINSEGFWAGTPADYLTLVKTASTAIRAADPQAVVVDAGLSSTTYGVGIADRLLGEGRVGDAISAYMTYYVNRIGVRDSIPAVSTESELRTALEDAQARRNLAYLAMDADLLKTGQIDVRQIHFYETAASVPALFEYLRATTPPDIPVEAWEVGSFVRGQDVGVDPSNVELVKKVSLLLASGATKVLWLPLIPSAAGRNADEPRTGLLDPDGTVRAAGRLYATLAADARGATASPVTTAGVTGVTMTKEGHTVAYLWATGPDVPVSAAGGTLEPVAAGSSTSVLTATPARVELSGALAKLVR